ncbi:MAG: helix-turn-helix transcriptional regulator [Gemmatimonadota bacterium]
MAPGDRRSSRARWPKLREELCRNLVRAREAAGLNQREAAERIGRPQSYVAKIETGERRVDAVEILQFVEAYGVELDSLLPRPAKT